MKRTAGFTLVEVVAGLALAGLLLTVLLTVTTRINHTRAALDDVDNRDRGRVDGLAALLRHDLIHARSFESSRVGVTMIGYGGLDRDTLEPTHRPARVTYRVLSVDGESGAIPVLVREQADLDDRTNREAYIELVAIGIDGFTIGGIGGGDGAAGSDAGSSAEVGGAAALPRRFEASWRWMNEPDREVRVTIDRG